MEVQAARIVAKRADPHDLKAIDRLCDRIGRLLSAGDEKRAAYVDFELHMKIVASSGCKLLVRQYEQIATICLVNRGGWDQDWATRESSGKTSHVRLVEALASGNADKAERAIRQHIGAERPAAMIQP